MLKGFESVMGQSKTWSVICKFSDVRESLQQTKRMNGSNMSPSRILNVLEPQIFQYNFLEGNSVKENSCYVQSTHRNVVTIWRCLYLC